MRRKNKNTMTFHKPFQPIPDQPSELNLERITTLKGKALAFARHAHDGQIRKFKKDKSDPDQPYITHPIAVAKLVEAHGGTQEMIAAALLHDTVEDCDVTLQEVIDTFGPTVGGLVEELTDVFTHEDYPSVNRAGRKKMERDRMKTISTDAKIIKLADLVDNSKSIVNDKNFAVVYFREKREILTEAFTDMVDHPLYVQANDNIDEYYDESK